MSNAALAVMEGGQSNTAEDGFTLMQRKARLLVASKLLPSEVDTPEKATAIMLKGIELGIPAMYALSNIVIVKGKPTCSAELMLALIRVRYGQRVIRVKESTDDHCTVEWRQDGWEGTQTYTWTIKQAHQAGLKAGNWITYPAAMLRARTISQVAKMAFPECIGGMYTPDELGASVRMTEDGEMFDLPMMEPAAPLVAVDGGHVNEETGEFRPVPDDAPETPPAPPQPSTAASNDDPGYDAVAGHDYRQRLYKNSREIEHATIRALAFHMWPRLTSMTQLTYREVDQLLLWINTTPPDVFDETVQMANEAAASREATAPTIDADEAARINFQEQIEAACADLRNAEAWQALTLSAGTEEWRWVMLMATAPTDTKLAGIHGHASTRGMLTEGVKAAHDRRLEFLSKQG